jgi:IS30 family transposase
MQRRWKLSLAQRAELWSRWKAGQSLHAIGRALGKDKQVIHFLLARHGGIAPPVRRRSRRALTLAEREDISRGCSMRVIAQGLSRACSTISREVARHGGRTIELAKRTPKPGSGPCGRRFVAWPCMTSSAPSLRVN